MRPPSLRSSCTTKASFRRTTTHRCLRAGDGSPLQRLHALHTRAKHAEAAIERGDFVEDSPLCVWLTNNGLRSTASQLAFDEIADILDDLAKWADAVQDPATMAAKLDSPS